MVEGPAGTVFASWWPFVEGLAATPDGPSIRETWTGGRLSGRVVTRYILERERAVQTGE